MKRFEIKFSGDIRTITVPGKVYSLLKDNKIDVFQVSSYYSGDEEEFVVNYFLEKPNSLERSDLENLLRKEGLSERVKITGSDD